MNKYEHIIKAATQLFATKQYHEVLMAQIAKKASVAKGTIYNYFKNKDELLFGVLEYGVVKLNHNVQMYVPGKGFEKDLANTIKIIMAYFYKNQYLFKLMHSEEYRYIRGKKSVLKEKMKEIEQSIAVIFSKYKLKKIRYSNNRKYIIQILLAIMRTVIMSGIEKKKFNSSKKAEEIVDLFLYGICGKKEKNS